MTAHIIFKHPNLPCSYPTVVSIDGDSEGMKIGDVGNGTWVLLTIGF
jgi:hypothetical protein